MLGGRRAAAESTSCGGRRPVLRRRRLVLSSHGCLSRSLPRCSDVQRVFRKGEFLTGSSSSQLTNWIQPAVRAEELEAMIWEHLACRSLRAHCEVLGLLCMHALWNTYSGYIVEGIFFIPAVSSLLRCEEVIYIHLTLTPTTDASQSRGAATTSLSNLGSRSLPPPRPSALLLVPMSDTDDEKVRRLSTQHSITHIPSNRTKNRRPDTSSSGLPSRRSLVA